MSVTIAIISVFDLNITALTLEPFHVSHLKT